MSKFKSTHDWKNSGSDNGFDDSIISMSPTLPYQVSEPLLVTLVRRIDSHDFNIIQSAMSEFESTLMSNDIRLTAYAECLTPCPNINQKNSDINLKWKKQLKEIILNKMGIDTDFIPVKIVKDWFSSLNQTEQDEANRLASKYLNSSDYNIWNSFVLENPDDMDDGGHTIMWEWAESELCTWIWLIIVIIIYLKVRTF